MVMVSSGFWEGRPLKCVTNPRLLRSLSQGVFSCKRKLGRKENHFAEDSAFSRTMEELFHGRTCIEKVMRKVDEKANSSDVFYHHLSSIVLRSGDKKSVFYHSLSILPGI